MEDLSQADLMYPADAQPRQARGWFFTINGSETDVEEWDAELHTRVDSINEGGDALVRCLAWQPEIGENGNHHLQGCLQTKRPARLSAVKSWLPGQAHLQVRRGTWAQAKRYCTKVDTRKPGALPMVCGDEPRQGARNDLVSIKERIDSGAKEAEIAEEFFGQWVRYYKAFNRYRGIKLPNRNFPTFTQVYWGPPGTGKTRRAFDEAGPDAYWLPKPNGSRVFWDGYEGQEHVVIDEFFGWMPRDLMCRVCDRYPFRVETKGGSVPFVAKKIWITSNSPPAEWWSRIGLGPMRRRLTAPLGSSIKIVGEGDLVLAEPGLELPVSIVD
jgi:hypothetical protein